MHSTALRIPINRSHLICLGMRKKKEGRMRGAAHVRKLKKM